MVQKAYIALPANEDRSAGRRLALSMPYTPGLSPILVLESRSMLTRVAQFFVTRVGAGLILAAGALLMTADVRADEPIKHSLFIAGPQFTGIIDEEEKVVWDAGRPGARDGFVLENGNLLIAWTNEVLEQTRDKKVVFRYAISPENQEIGTVARLANGRTMITELGKNPRLLEVDADGKIVVEVKLAPETDNAHMQTRMARKLESGNYLVPHLLAFKVKEYAPDGKVVREIATDLPQFGGRKVENWPFTAIVMKDGKTFVNLTHGDKSAIFDRDGKVVWSVSNEDFPEKPFADPCGAQLLPNGNVVIASYASRGPIKAFEVTPDKKIVWQYKGKYNIHELQILTTNGKPVAGAPQK